MPVHTTLIPAENLVLPAIYSGSPSHHSVVIVLHGLGVSKEVQIPELQRLKASGMFAVAIDAPHHGERDDGYLQLMDRQKSDLDKHLFLLKIVFQQAAEVSALINFYKAQQKKVAVVGISMGGFSAFAILGNRVKADLIAPFLASPDFRCKLRPENLPLTIPEQSGPFDSADFDFSQHLLMVNAGNDKVVDIAPCASFFNRLKGNKDFDARRIEFHQYSGSDHFMKPADWCDAWEKLTDKLSRLNFQ